MTDERIPPGGADQPMLDELLRAGVPEIKLALGEVIDRENARPLPPRYARLLPETRLAVTLRTDAAEAAAPIAASLERELTDSCNRHGSLYDRSYRVRLQRTDDPDAPLYAVSVEAGEAAPEPRGAAEESKGGSAAAANAGRVPGATTARGAGALPLAGREAPRGGLGSVAGWTPGRWVLVVVGNDGEEREAFRLAEPLLTLGRRTGDAKRRASIAIGDAAHVSRRQLALEWEERDGAAGFRLYNLGLNPVHLPGQDLAGARVAGDAPDLDAVPEGSVGWVPPGVPIRIGDQGPTLRIEEVPPGPEEVWIDPDATVFE